ncbi:Aminopeptidase YpdF [bacterium HR33]|nr:Aminopeptidase YpdF [bacterium HR33]
MDRDRYAARREKLRAALEAEGLDGLIVTRLANVRYLTGFTGTSGVVLLRGNESVFFTDFRYRTQAEGELGRCIRVEVVSSDLWGRLWEVLAEGPSPAEVGFEAQAVSVADRFRFPENGKFRFRPVEGMVERLRICKEPEEVAAIGEAARLAMEALEATLERVKAGQTELEVAAILEGELRRRGSEWHPFPTIVASGSRTALPHARTSCKAIERGEWLLLDFGAQVDGYCADVTRTVVVGSRPDERQAAVYEMVREAQLRARCGIRAGMTGREADALARSVIEARGFGEAFGHSLGHGLGLEVHEGPRLNRTSTEPIPPHAVVTIEPGAYFPGWGGVRIEDDVYLAPEGPQLLTDGNTELRVVG